MKKVSKKTKASVAIMRAEQQKIFTRHECQSIKLAKTYRQNDVSAPFSNGRHTRPTHHLDFRCLEEQYGRASFQIS